MKVKAVPGIKAPLLNKPGSFITPARIVEVEESHYYRSMVNDGDLIEATDKEWAAQQEADAKEEASAAAAAKAAAKAVKSTATN